MVFLTALFDETKSLCFLRETYTPLEVSGSKKSCYFFCPQSYLLTEGQGDLKRQWGRWDSWKTYLDTVLQTAATDGTRHSARPREPVTNQEIPSSSLILPPGAQYSERN